MRTLTKNKQKMHYSHYLGELTEYERDADGNIIYIEVDGQQEAVETGGVVKTYDMPVIFYASISSTLNKLAATSYGVDQSNIYSTIVIPKNTVKLIPGDLIWRTAEIEYDESGYPSEASADYRVMGYMNEGLHEDYYLLQRLSVEEV